MRFLLGVRGEVAWRLHLYQGELTCRKLFLSHHLQPAPSYLFLAYLPGMRFLLGVLEKEPGDYTCTWSTWRRSLEILCQGETCRNLFLSHHLQPAPSLFLAYLPGMRFLLGVRGEGAWRLHLYQGELTCRNLFLSHHLQPAPLYLSPSFSEGCSSYLEYVEKDPGD